MFEIGELVCVKTTGEEGIVLHAWDNGSLQVRIPKMTRDGIEHHEWCFHPFELESKLDNFKRDLQWHVMRQRLIKDAETSTTIGDATNVIAMPKKDPQIN